MTDPLLTYFAGEREAIDPLPPPVGAFEHARRTAQHRRRRRAMAGAGALAAVAVLGGGLAVPLAHLGTRSTRQVAAAGGAVKAGFRPMSVTFVSSTRGWLLGNARCGNRPCLAVAETDDGGRSWHDAPAPRQPDGGQPALTGIRFASARDGWAWGDGLWSTHDGGLTWRRHDPGRVLAIEASGVHVYAVVASCGASVPGCAEGQPAVITTERDGDAWQSTGRVGTLATGGAEVPSLSVIRDTVAVVAGPVGGRRAFVSTTGGRQWRAVRSPCQGAPLSALTVVDDRVLDAICGDQMVYRSVDGGSRFTHLIDMLHMSDQQGRQVAGLAATSRTVVVAYTGAGAGATLVARDLELAPHATSYRVDWPPAGFRYVGTTTASQFVALPAVADGYVWFSRNAGVTWSAVRVAAPSGE